jgi:hypothetical protein
MNGRATRLPGGSYQFQARLVQPNDSYCPQIWWTPVPSPSINVGWLIVEEGVYNITSSQLIFASGEMTRENSVPNINDDRPALYHAKVVMNFTTGCDVNDLDAVCEFVEKISDFPPITIPAPGGGTSSVVYSATGWSHLGASNQIQTSINKVPDDPSKELWMNTRVRQVFPDRIVMLLAVHSVYSEFNKDVMVNIGPNNFNFTLYPDYADIHTAEVVSYFVWEKNIRLTCVEGLVMETSIEFPVTDRSIQMDYFYEYESIPGLFSMIGSLNSLGDTTSLRVFNRTISGSRFITQEDQCTDEELKHTTSEVAFSMVVGKAKGVLGTTQCFIAYDVKPCTYTINLYDLFNDGWANNVLRVDTGKEILSLSTSCGNKAVTFISPSCTWNAYMETTDDKKPVTWWENYWRYEHVNTINDDPNVVYIGDYDSTISVVRETVTFTDLVNTRADAQENKCEKCQVAPPPPPKGGPKGKAADNADGGANNANGGVADLSAGNVAPTPPAGVGVAPSDPGAPEGVLQVTGVEGPIDASAAPGTGTFTLSYSLNVVGLGSAVDSIAFYRGATGIVGPSMHSLDVTGLTTTFFIEGSFVVNEVDLYNEFALGNIYIQVNTANFLTGEIRAQVVLPTGWDVVDAAVGGGGDHSAGDGFGKGGKGPAAGKGAGKAAPAPPVPVLIELFEETGDGWYNNSGTWSYPMTFAPAYGRRVLHPALALPPRQNWVLDNTVDILPDILMYPTYVIMTADKTRQLHVGSLCPRRGVERCEERLPPHGEFVFRVMGKDPEGDDSWKFCGIEGHIGQELQFEMKKGKCVAVSVTNAYTYCSFNTKVSLSGGLILTGVSTEFSEFDSKVLENEIASMLVATTHVSIVSWAVNAEGNTEVAFEATILAEKQGVDGSIRENVDALVSALQVNIETAFTNGAFLSSVETTLAEYPQSMVGIKAATSVTLTSFTVTNIEYVEASTSITERSPASLPVATQQTQQQTAAAVQEEGASTIITICGVIGVVVAFAFVAVRARQSSQHGHHELSLDSEHAEDSIPEFDLGLEAAAAPRGLFFSSKERF